MAINMLEFFIFIPAGNQSIDLDPRHLDVKPAPFNEGKDR